MGELDTRYYAYTRLPRFRGIANLVKQVKYIMIGGCFDGTYHICIAVS